jgi:hypothetical protein
MEASGMGEKPTEVDEGDEESRSPNFPVRNTTTNMSDEASGSGEPSAIAVGDPQNDARVEEDEGPSGPSGIAVSDEGAGGSKNPQKK